MKDTQSLHLKTQELIDCYAGTDPLREMSTIKNDSDQIEAALKWFALTVLHGINSNAKEVSISVSDTGETKVTATYRESELPDPGSEVGAQIIQALREITHINGDKGKMPLALGIGDSTTDLELSIKAKKDRQKATIKF